MPDTELAAEQELDRIYHALPDWCNRQFREEPLSDRVKHGFEEIQQILTDTIKRDCKERDDQAAFIQYLIKTHGLNFGNEYWNYLRSKETLK